MKDLGAQDLKEKLKEKGVELIRLINEEENLRDRCKELVNGLVQTEVIRPDVGELEPYKQANKIAQGTIEEEIKLEVNENEKDLARDACATMYGTTNGSKICNLQETISLCRWKHLSYPIYKKREG